MNRYNIPVSRFLQCLRCGRNDHGLIAPTGLCSQCGGRPVPLPNKPPRESLVRHASGVVHSAAPAPSLPTGDTVITHPSSAVPVYRIYRPDWARDWPSDEAYGVAFRATDPNTSEAQRHFIAYMTLRQIAAHTGVA